MRLGLFGLPGAGKGTQAVRMAQKWAIPHISTGDIFRELQKTDSPLSREIHEIMASGALVSDDLVTKVALVRLAKDDCHAGFILDGYPRTLPQAEALQSSPFALDALLAFKIERQEIVKRLSGRRICPTCKSIYGPDMWSDQSQGKCPNDGTNLVQRADDLPESIDIRLSVYEKNFSQVLSFYETLGRLCYIDGQGSADMVFERITKLVKDKGWFKEHN